MAFVKATAVLLRQRLTVPRGCGDGSDDGVHHDFEELSDSGKLHGVELVGQLVGMMSVHIFFVLYGDSLMRAARTYERRETRGIITPV